MGFEYPFTCPTIDEAYEDLERELDKYFNSTLGEDYPLDIFDLVDEVIKGPFEKVRETNIHMREEAETLVDTLENKISELEEEVADLLYNNKTLSDEVDELTSKCERLQEEVFNLMKEIKELED